MVKLGDICKFQSGGTPTKGEPSYFNGNIPWITTVALNGKCIDEKSAVDWITEKAIEKSAAKIVPPNSIMVGTRVGVGKVAINKVAMSTSQDIISLLEIDESRWSKSFICKFIQGKGSYLNSQARGATIKGIKIDTLAGLQLPNVTLDAQYKIAAILDKIDQLISLRKEQLAKLDQLVKSRFVDLFGDEQRFLAKACNQVSDVCESKVGIVIQPTQYYTEDTNNSVKAFRSLNVKPFRVNDADWVHFTVESNNLMQRTQVHTNDVAVVRSGVNLGDSCVVPAEFDGCNAIDILILTPKSCILPVYLSAFINYPCGKNQIINAQRGGALKHLNNKQLQDAQIYLPPIKLQKQFADFVEQTEKTKLTIQSSLDKLEVLKKSLMQEYFG